MAKSIYGSIDESPASIFSTSLFSPGLNTSAPRARTELHPVAHAIGHSTHHPTRPHPAVQSPSSNQGQMFRRPRTARPSEAHTPLAFSAPDTGGGVSECKRWASWALETMKCGRPWHRPPVAYPGRWKALRASRTRLAVSGSGRGRGRGSEGLLRTPG